MKLKNVVVCLTFLFSFGCGASTPGPESAESAQGDASTQDTNEDGHDDEGYRSSDPETTEEVIETSEPLD